MADQASQSTPNEPSSNQLSQILSPAPSTPSATTPTTAPSTTTPNSTRTSTPTTSAASDVYWARLSATITDANVTLSQLKPPSNTVPCPEHGPRGRLAHLLQGLSPSGVERALEAEPQSDQASLRALYKSGVVGVFTDYGVPEPHIPWVAHTLSQPVGNRPSAAASSPAIPPAPALEEVDRLRVRVFEADIAFLSPQVAELVARARRTARRFRSRLDAVVRILLAAANRGRRVSQASLDRLKVSLDKLDRQQRVENERLAAAAASAAAPVTSSTGTSDEVSGSNSKRTTPRKPGPLPSPARRKRDREMSAQASFMKRFVKQKVDRPVPAVVEVATSRPGSFAAIVAEDPDVMSASWWLRSETRALSLESMDLAWKATLDVDPSVLQQEALSDHLAKCAVRRRGAQRSVNSALFAYRERRTDHKGDRTPRFTRRRTECRGIGPAGAVKLLQFAENHRPAFYGMRPSRSTAVRARRPFAKDITVDYDYDSEQEWDDDEDGEDLMDVEADTLDKENEDAELRRLYGTEEDDDEDDEEFYDVGAGVEDDEDEGDDNSSEATADENESLSPPLQDSEASPKVGTNSTDQNERSKVLTKNELIDLTLSVKKTAKDAKEVSRKRAGKRRKAGRQSVSIDGVSFPVSGVVSRMDLYPVTMVSGVSQIPMFNPFVYNVADMMAEQLKSKGGSIMRSTGRSTMDELARLDLALALIKGGSSRDRIIIDFCEYRKAKGLNVPPKSEIIRVLGEMATREKREGDTRAGWYLRDGAMATKVEQLLESNS